MNPDLILYNGTIYPKADGRERAEAVAVWNGVVSDVGSTRDILRLRARSVHAVDLMGRTVLPGFTDSHIHLLGYGMMLKTVQLYDATSINDVRESVSKAAKKSRPEQWIVGRGWDQEKLLEHRYLESKDLDDLGSNPIFLRRVCGHIGVANSTALRIAGVNRETTVPDGGVIVTDSTGEPTGLLKESALGLVEEKIEVDDRTIEESLVRASQKLLRYGLTSFHCVLQNARESRILKRLCDEGKVKQSIYGIMPYDSFDEAVGAGVSTDLGPARPGFRIGGVKIFMDGSLGARTAALTEPYSDENGTMGILTFSEQKLADTVTRAEAAGLQLCMHAIGDRALGTILKVLEDKSESSARKSLRHRIEHASLAPPALLTRMRRLGIVASVQPRFIYSDSWAGARLGERRARSLYPFRSMKTKGIPLAAGSDGPVEDPNPLEGIWSAVARPGLSPSERLTVPEAFAMYTAGGAYASHSESNSGTIRVGSKADLVVLEADPFSLATNKLRKLKVTQTIVNGEIAYTAN